MVKIILQPTGQDTINDAKDIMGNLDLAEYEQFLEESEFVELSKIYKDGKASCWSIKPGERKAGKWERIDPGDVVLFSQKGLIVASATVTFKLHNNTLGSEFIGPDEDGEIYDYFYFFDNVKNQNISIKDFNNAAGYSPGNIIRGFEVLSEDVSKKNTKFFSQNRKCKYKDN